jgi:AraC-like DNA-binding protein
MLKEGASINDVAYSCGFSDPKYFAKCFKADMEMTPTEYKVENSAN